MQISSVSSSYQRQSFGMQVPKSARSVLHKTLDIVGAQKDSQQRNSFACILRAIRAIGDSRQQIMIRDAHCDNSLFVTVMNRAGNFLNSWEVKPDSKGFERLLRKLRFEVPSVA